MGSNTSKRNSLSDKFKISKIGRDLTKKDLKLLSKETGIHTEEIQFIYTEFTKQSTGGCLDLKEFVNLYTFLRPEPSNKLMSISEYIFKCFDSDKNGYITFNEFLFAYAFTSRGDLERKLSYIFDMYDIDNSGYIESDELEKVLNGMLDMLGADKDNLYAITEQCMVDLDENGDGKISKEEFISNLSANYGLRTLMSPFN